MRPTVLRQLLCGSITPGLLARLFLETAFAEPALAAELGHGRLLLTARGHHHLLTRASSRSAVPREVAGPSCVGEWGAPAETERAGSDRLNIWRASAFPPLRCAARHGDRC